MAIVFHLNPTGWTFACQHWVSIEQVQQFKSLLLQFEKVFQALTRVFRAWAEVRTSGTSCTIRMNCTD